MKCKWISLFCLLCLFYGAFSQDLDPKEAKILQNKYGEIVYGNKQLPILAFFQKDSLKYIYSQQKNKVAILRKDNTILKEVSFKNKDFTLARFQPYSKNGVILQSWGLDRDYILLENQNLSIKKQNTVKSKKIIAYQVIITEEAIFEVHQYMVTPSNSCSKVLLCRVNQKIDTLYQDTKTKENRNINVSPRAELVYFQDKLYFFNADQRLILIFEAKTGKLSQEINLKEQEDEYLKGYILNFYIDTATNTMYVSGVFANKTYIWEIKADKTIERFEIPFQIYLIHQILEDKIYFSLQTEEDNLYVYERKFK